MTAEDPNGRYPIMQNPGDPRTPDGATFTPKKHVLILDGAALVKPGDFDERVALFPHGHPSDEEEAQARAETTYHR